MVLVSSGAAVLIGKEEATLGLICTGILQSVANVVRCQIHVVFQFIDVVSVMLIKRLTVFCVEIIGRASTLYVVHRRFGYY